MSLHMRIQKWVQSTFLLWKQVDQALSVGCVCQLASQMLSNSVLLKDEPAESRAKDPRLINPVQSKFGKTDVRGL